MILFGFAVVLFLSWQFDIFHGVISAARHHQWGRFIVSPAILWAGMGMLMLLLRTLLWFRYRTPPLATMTDAPTLTVIIPAYNEGEMVARSIESVVPRAIRASVSKSSSSTMAAPTTRGSTSSASRGAFRTS